MKHFTEAEMIKAIQGSCGNISLIAVTLNCSWATARKYISNNDELRELYKGETERLLDKAEEVIKTALFNGEDKKTQLATAKWLLTVKGRSRGYNFKGHGYRNALIPYTSDFIKRGLIEEDPDK